MLTSLQNPLVKRILALRDRKTRQEQACFLIEGRKELRHALQAGLTLDTLIRCPEILTGQPQSQDTLFLLNWLDNQNQNSLRLEDVSARVYAKLAYRDSVEGVLAIAKMPRQTLADITLKDQMALLVVDSVEKPGNLGALLRTADGAGMDAVIACGHSIDIYNPNVVRAAVGALFTQPVIETPAPTLRDWLSQHHFTTILTSPAAQKRYDQIDYKGRIAIVLGSEKDGLDSDWLNAPGLTVAIPMHGQMDSLNLACSGAILMYTCRKMLHS